MSLRLSKVSGRTGLTEKITPESNIPLKIFAECFPIKLEDLNNLDESSRYDNPELYNNYN